MTDAPTQLAQAVAVFGSELRVELLRYFAGDPRKQKHAALDLGILPTTVSKNVSALLATGALRDLGPAADDRRATLFVTDTDRVRELSHVLVDHVTAR